MRNTLSNLLLACTSMAILNACGSGDSSLTGHTQAQQAQQVQRATQAVPSDYQTVVQQLYIAYFGRPADPAGLASFENALLAANAPTDVQAMATSYTTNPAVQTLIDGFATSKESQALYAGTNTAAFVTAIFNNVLGRAPLTAGLNYWVNAIDNEGLSQGAAALSIMAGALGNTTTQGKLDAQLVSNRATVAETFTTQLYDLGVSDAYSGANAASAARILLAGVDATTDTTAFISSVQSGIAALPKVTGVSLLAGNIGGFGNIDGTGTMARFGTRNGSLTGPYTYSGPAGAAVDGNGNIYVADTYSNTIRKITPAGVVTTLAGMSGVVGSNDGIGAAARFSQPQGVAADASGNVYVADTGNCTIRKITPDGVVTTIAGQVQAGGSTNGLGAAALFLGPFGIAVDGAGNLYVSELDNNDIRKITPNGMVTTLAGTAGVVGSADGTGAAASFNEPSGLAVDSAGNVYVAEQTNDTVRKITPAGVTTTLAGLAQFPNSTDGTGSSAFFFRPTYVAVDAAGNVYVADTWNDEVRKITPAGVVTTFAGTANKIGVTDGSTSTALFDDPYGIAVDVAGNVYVNDSGSGTIRKISTTGTVTTLAGLPAITGSANGIGAAASFNNPAGSAIDANGNVYVADQGNNTIRKISPSGTVTTLAGTAGVSGAANGTAGATFRGPTSVAADVLGNVYVADTGNNVIRMVTPGGVVSTFAGTAGAAGAVNGSGAAASFNAPKGIAIDGAGNLYVADSGNNIIRKITPSALVTTFAGTAGVSGGYDGTGAAAAFNLPWGIATDASGNVYVADANNNTIRKITPAGVVRTLAGIPGEVGYVDSSGGAPLFNAPTGVGVDSSGNVYVADALNNVIRMITPAGNVSTVAGSNVYSGIVLGALPGSLSYSEYLSVNTLGVIYLSSSDAILKVTLPQTP